MKDANQDPSGATDPSVSDDNQNNSDNTQISSGKDTVAYDTHKKLLGEKKSLQARFEEMQSQFNKMNEDKLSAEGKKDELIEAYKARITDMEQKVNNFAYTSVSNSVQNKAREMGCVAPDKVDKFIDLSSLKSIGDDFNTDPEEVKMVLEGVKKENPWLFKPVNPNVNNSVPNKNPNVEDGKVDFSTMTKEELIAYGNKHGL